MKYILLVAFLVFCGCATPRWGYINDVDLEVTRKIGSADIGRLPAALTIGELFRRWGPAAGGKELIYAYRSSIDGISLFIFAELPDADSFDVDVGSARITKMIFLPDGGRDFLVVWESKK